MNPLRKISSDWLFAAGGSRRWLWLSFAIMALDQLTKYYAENRLEFARPNKINDYLDLTLLHNTGAAFSFLSDASGWQRYFFITLGVAVSVFIFVWLGRLVRGTQRMLAAGLAMILAGALGNVIDRIYYGYVIDFLHFHYADHYWPAFNLADTAISIGAGLLILDVIFSKEAPSQSAAD